MNGYGEEIALILSGGEAHEGGEEGGELGKHLAWCRRELLGEDTQRVRKPQNEEHGA